MGQTEHLANRNHESRPLPPALYRLVDSAITIIRNRKTFADTGTAMYLGVSIVAEIRYGIGHGAKTSYRRVRCAASHDLAGIERRPIF